MFFNLEDLLQRSEGLSHLTDPFTNKEIDEVIANLPNDKFQDQMVSIQIL
jgi:hypothetical protein